MILDKIISIKRLSLDTDNSQKESYVANAALQSVKCHIQPMGPEEVVLSDGVYAQSYLCFTTCSGIKAGDHVTVSGTGQQLRVKGVENWSMDPMPHYEMVLIEMEEDEV